MDWARSETGDIECIQFIEISRKRFNVTEFALIETRWDAMAWIDVIENRN
jgi:hypothetical protein